MKLKLIKYKSIRIKSRRSIYNIKSYYKQHKKIIYMIIDGIM